MDVSKDLVKMLVKDLATAMDMRKTVEDLAFNDLIDKTEKAEQLMMSLNTMKLVLEEEGPQKRLIMEVVTAEYKINFLGGFQGGGLRAVGRVVKPGKRLIIATAEVTHVGDDGQEGPCALMQQTLVPVPKTY